MTNDLFADAVGHLLEDQCTPQIIRDIEAGASAQSLWQQIEAAGFADAMVSELDGGAGLCLSELFGVFELCGRHASPVPLAETVVARALLAAAGAVRPAGSIVLAAGATAIDGGIVCNAVSGGRVADWALVVVGDQALLLDCVAARHSAAVYALDATLHWPAQALMRATRLHFGHDLNVLQACISAAQLAGALMSVFDRTLQFANERNQFGRPIGKFQAIQHQLAVMAEHAFAARMAAQIGCASTSVLPDRLRVAVAKARASEAAVAVAALSHSIHGAIGFTAEFDLQLYTRRLHAWRQAGGSESYWHSVLGMALVEGPPGHALELIRGITDAQTLESSS